MYLKYSSELTYILTNFLTISQNIVNIKWNKIGHKMLYIFLYKEIPVKPQLNSTESV